MITWSVFPFSFQMIGTTVHSLDRSGYSVVCTVLPFLFQSTSAAWKDVSPPHGATLFAIKHAWNASATPSSTVWQVGAVTLRIVPDNADETAVLGSPPSSSSVAMKPSVASLGVVYKLLQRGAGAPGEKGAVCPASIRESLANQLDKTTYRRVLEEISGARAFTLDGRETTIRTRSTGTVGVDQAADHLAGLCAQYGYAEQISVVWRPKW
jgi:hypothetical protein